MIMRTIIQFLLYTFSIIIARAQYKVSFEIGTLPVQHRDETLFIAGGFNQWNPAAAGYSFTGGDLPLRFTTSLAAGTYEYKITRGSWNKVECRNGGGDIPNRVVQLSSDTVIRITIDAWADDYTKKPSATASTNVQVLDTAFMIPELGNRKRRIWAYLPPGYATGNKRYPVLYMNDGQNLFDERTAPFGEWGVDECLDTLLQMGRPACIVIGIDHGGEKRMTEYNPYTFDRFGAGEGDRYVDFIVKTLKPFVDKHFRTQAGPSGTIIAGSSMGGLISCYAALKYPSVFGGAGVFSPAFWTAPELDQYIDSLTSKIRARFFFYAGAKESDAMVPDMQRIADKIALKGDNLIYSVVDEEGKHNEAAWRKWLPVFYDWMMNNSAH